MSVIAVDPSVIYFTHSRIKPHFSIGKPILDTYMEIETGRIAVSDIPMITVYYIDGKYYSLNNRRLFLFKLCQSNGILSNQTINVICKEVPSSRIISQFRKNTYSLTAKLKECKRM